jgi:tetratricopeptide (TPR) repeat protein
VTGGETAGLAARRRSVAALELGRLSEAVRYAREAVAASPDSADSHCVLANALNASGSYEEGRDESERACALAPDSDYAHALRATALYKLGRCAQALEAIDESIRLQPSFAPRHVTRARILALLRRFKEAAQEAARACELAPENPQTHDAVADLAFAAGRYADAERAWRTALQLDPTSAMRLNNYGAALDRQGRKEDARDAYRRAIRMDPSLGVSKRNLHRNVRSSLRVGAMVAGAGGIGAFKFCGIVAPALNGVAHATSYSSRNGDGGVVFVLVAVLIVIGGWAASRGWRARSARRREEELEARDPALMRMYRQIDADIAAGRITEK